MWPFSCAVCGEKDKLIDTLKADILIARLQCDESKRREHDAVNQLLEVKGRKVVNPLTPLHRSSADDAHAEAFSFFKDTFDNGKGNVTEVDQLSEVTGIPKT